MKKSFEKKIGCSSSIYEIAKCQWISCQKLSKPSQIKKNAGTFEI